MSTFAFYPRPWQRDSAAFYCNRCGVKYAGDLPEVGSRCTVTVPIPGVLPGREGSREPCTGTVLALDISSEMALAREREHAHLVSRALLRALDAVFEGGREELNLRAVFNVEDPDRVWRRLQTLADSWLPRGPM